MREFIEKETNKRLEVTIPMDAFEDIDQTLASLERQDLFLGKDVNENGAVWNNKIGDYVPMDEDPIELNETDLKCSRELYHSYTQWILKGGSHQSFCLCGLLFFHNP